MKYQKNKPEREKMYWTIQVTWLDGDADNLQKYGDWVIDRNRVLFENY